MFDLMKKKSIDEVIKENDQKLKELEIEFDSMKREADAHFKALDVTREQLKIYVGDESNFSPNQWEQVQEAKKALDEQLKRAVSNVRNTEKTKETLKSLNVDRSWLAVK